MGDKSPFGNCPECGSNNIARDGVQEYRTCLSCGLQMGKIEWEQQVFEVEQAATLACLAMVTIRTHKADQLLPGDEVDWLVQDDGESTPPPSGSLVLFDNGEIQRVGVVCDASYADISKPYWSVYGVVLAPVDDDRKVLLGMI